MNYIEVKEFLSQKIEDQLKPLISSDYVLWDLPYHMNMGDILIWEGTLDFLDKLPFSMLDYGSAFTVKFPRLEENVTILLHGGGNFGDIYRSSQEFRNKVIETYPNNRIIVLPQSIHYNEEDNLKADMKVFQQHNDLYVCVRDSFSYQTLINFLDEKKLILLPDMAFCIKSSKLLPRASNKTLFMERIDCEAVNNLNVNFTFDKVSDWPSFEYENMLTKVLRQNVFIQQVLNKINKKIKIDLYPSFSHRLDKYMVQDVKPFLFEQSINFINQYDTIYTTRLHGCILAVLLGKNIYLMDNNYGKNTRFFNEWLQDYENIMLYKGEV
ncbi:polysaccharide pyruvyl transferase family protein [Acinetobacter baumannii]|uniref:polysaccharide pyruvyl transferase family protein n=2 Tax=Acinetobacter baumannii TaxID=470 RepID=UPI0025A14508|nr:polysaccharide pyruvyl transferase family protein [Acinetobacter baumannii]